ncbi:MAG: glutamine synthetase type III [Porphyromonadaceae bacterium]|nr:glutamine synthetase type III [Porphyromonadaceae bacterium]
MSEFRFRAVEEASKRLPIEVESPGKQTSEYYGNKVFDRKQMARYLSRTTMKIITDAIDEGKTLPREVAEHVAVGMKQWSMEMGVTHYTHWFQPLTDGTAEKHDSFIDYADVPGGDIIEKFSGKLLAQQEPDASSFPSGGIRNTFEARGYTAWDPSSPAFIVNDTLCIPTVFISYTGEALDYKTPLLKALSAVDRAAVDVCKLFDSSVKKVNSFLGWEQEFFLVDTALYHARPDLKLTGRTLMGHESAKNQQLEDHYFGAVPLRVAAFMREVEFEAYKYGIPLKTRHNEVAPNQFEIAPIYGETNLAIDQNLLVMSIMDKIATKHHFKLLLHEKPFAGVNGSGKHNNWSLGTDTGIGLFTPGKTPNENLMFITFIVNAMMAVYKNNALLKASIMTANNAHRLGANEAPPAIISVFLGSQISSALDKIENSSEDDDITVEELQKMKLGVAHIPEVLIDNTDRNRTSPFAFTGNRFEFRAVGSSANCSTAMIVLNSVMAYQLVSFKNEIDKKMNSGLKKEEAIYETLRLYIKESKAIRFDGNGYSNEWKEEAEKRGLDCETSVPLVIDNYTSEKTLKMFESIGVMNERELEARNEVKWETYTKKIQIEARVLGDLSMNHIIPVATKYQTSLLDNVYKLNCVFESEKAKVLNEHDIALIEDIAVHISGIKTNVDAMVEARKIANRIENIREKAIVYHDTVLPFFDIIRYHIDKLELIVDNEMWPLPKYRELLFVS